MGMLVGMSLFVWLSRPQYSKLTLILRGTGGLSRNPAVCFCMSFIKEAPMELSNRWWYRGWPRGLHRHPKWGSAASGNCAWWGHWIQDTFAEKGMLYCMGRNLGIRTNNFAEVRGLAFAAKSALLWHFWVTESCTQATARQDYMH